MFAIGIVMLTYKLSWISYHILRKCEQVIAMVAYLKVVVWAVVELNLFVAVMVPSCSGGVFAYGLVLAILHTILVIWMGIDISPI
jgi:hypothetical protein